MDASICAPTSFIYYKPHYQFQFQLCLHNLGFWGLSVSRKRNSEIFDALVATLGDTLSKHVQNKIIHGTYNPLTDGVDIVPQGLWLPKVDDIPSLLDTKVEGVTCIIRGAESEAIWILVKFIFLIQLL